jgi:carbon starvation protein
MNILFIVAGAAVVFIAAYRLYGRFLARRVFGLDDARATPAVSLQDGLDYVPTPARFLSGQHFSAIAAAGPITGPIIAGLAFGWAPALLWVLVGAVFIGGVHDMGALIASVRHKARSITEVLKENVSRRAWLLFMIFIWITLVYIIVAFTDITSSSFVATITAENGQKIGGGAIATSSLLYLALPLIMGLLLRKKVLNLTWATIIFLPLVGAAIWAGPHIPLDLTSLLGLSAATAQKAWSLFILVYCFIASIIPVWMLLQPRGHLGGYFLYAALITCAIGLIGGGFKVSYPAFALAGRGPAAFWFPMIPILFITVACGACSGFHALVGSGTTSKQLAKESDAKPIGYGMMLMEGLVAVISLACVMILAKGDPLVQSSPNFIYASGIGRFLDLIGIPAAYGISFGLMAFATFVYDTLDVCTRLGRYIIHEITGWKGPAGRAVATLLTIGVPAAFLTATLKDAAGRTVPAWKIFWSLFGASNQLLAALALMAVSIWLFRTARNRKAWRVAAVPSLWMFLMSAWALLVLMRDGWWKGGVLRLTGDAVPVVALILFLLAALMAGETARALWRSRGGRRAGAA